MSSFYCEHTAEYILVPKLQRILNEKFKIVSPIYFWKTREGNNLSKALHKNQHVKMAAFFPRRPKEASLSENTLSGKINYTLFNYFDFASSKEVPVLAGLPLTRSLIEFANCDEFIWLHFKNNYPYDLHFDLDINTKEVSFFEDQRAVEVIREVEINQLVANNSKIYSWQEAINFMDEARQYTSQGNGFFWFGGQYKPIYFLIFESLGD